MSTLEEMGRKYAAKLMDTGDKQLAARKIVEEINNLTYINTDKHISKEDKKQILDSMLSHIKNHIIKEADNKNYLELVNYIQAKLGGEK